MKINIQIRATDEKRFISIMHISSPNPMFGHLVESSHRDDSNMWSNLGFGNKSDIQYLLKFILRFLSRAMTDKKNIRENTSHRFNLKY